MKITNNGVSIILQITKIKRGPYEGEVYLGLPKNVSLKKLISFLGDDTALNYLKKSISKNLQGAYTDAYTDAWENPNKESFESLFKEEFVRQVLRLS